MRLLSIFNIHVPSPPQGADKDRKGPDGISAFEAAEGEAIKALLKWDTTVWEVAGQVGERTDRQMDAVVPWQKTDSSLLPWSTSVLTLLLSVCWRVILSVWWFSFTLFIFFFSPCFWDRIFSSLASVCSHLTEGLVNYVSLRDQTLGERSRTWIIKHCSD